MSHACRVFMISCCVALSAAASTARADGGATGAAPPLTEFRTVMSDAGAYVAAPFHWSGRDWAYAGGALATLALAHHYDGNVRQHFAPAAGTVSDSSGHDTQDWLPAAALLGGAWAYGLFGYNRAAQGVAWNMTEAAGFSGVTALALRYAGGRERPDQTSDPNRWRHGGSSFPSLHVTVTFAAATVFAESGNDDTLWLTRGLGYGLAGAAAYQRLKHNAHWLSDVAAGAALGAGTGLFVMHRANQRAESADAGHLLLAPTDGGLMLAYSSALDF